MGECIVSKYNRKRIRKHMDSCRLDGEVIEPFNPLPYGCGMYDVKYTGYVIELINESNKQLKE